MKKLIIISLMTVLMSACGDKEAEQQPEVVEVVKAEVDILSYVPAQTPLYFASGLSNNLYPDRYVSVMQDNLKNVANYLQVALSDMDDTIQQIQDKNGEADIEPEDTKKVKNFIEQWFLDGEFSKLGIRVGESQMVGYTVDLFPVIRIKLAAGNQVDAMFNDLDQQFVLSPQVGEQDGLTIREYQADEVTVLAGHNTEYLVLSLAPSVIKDKLVASLMGVEKPAQNMAQNMERLNQVKTKHGFVMDDLFVMDVQAIADYFINPDSHDSALLDFLQIEDNKLSPVCKTEINGMLAKAPRLVAGNTSLTDEAINSALIWEMDSELSLDMATMAGRIPPVDENAAFSFGMSVDILNTQQVLTKYIGHIINEPYQCELFTQLNQQAETMKAQLSQPLPGFISNFKGFNMAFSDLKVNEEAANSNNPAEMIESFKMQMALSVDEAQALVGMAQMMLPQLQGMALPTDGSLIPLHEQLPADLTMLPVDLSSAYAAINNKTIGLSLGYPNGGQLTELVNKEGENLLFSATADAEGYRQILEEIFKLADMPQLSDDMKKQLENQKQMSLSMLYWKHQKVTMNFTDQGFTTNMVITY